MQKYCGLGDAFETGGCNIQVGEIADVEETETCFVA